MGFWIKTNSDFCNYQCFLVFCYIDLPTIVVYITQIDVENPCVIMSQDKSREFLHSGNAKDKFKVRR